MTLLHIARGWYNYITSTPYTQELMDKRLAICDVCDKKQQLGSVGELLVTTINKEGSLFKCGECNCPLSAKTADPTSSCPLNKWSVAGTESYF